MGVLAGKAIVITGGAGVLGAAYAVAMAREGARLLINDVDGEAVERVVADVQAQGAQAVGSTDSVATWAGAGRIIDACVDAFGRIDCLVNSAHQFRRGPIWEMTEEALDLTVTVHLKGHFACTHHAAQRMKEQRAGSIVTVTSRALHGMPGNSPYATVKAGILGATWSWALELADYGVRVNCVSPAALKNPAFQPTMHMRWHTEFTVEHGGQQHDTPTADTVAPLVVYLASDESRWVTGQVIFLSGDTLALMDQPQYRFALKPDGWSVDDLRTRFRELMGPHLAQPGQGEPRYRWHGGVGEGE
ncbi:MAG: SDR family oxidoreductase [Dehalococcoidia bacterium]